TSKIRENILYLHRSCPTWDKAFRLLLTLDSASLKRVRYEAQIRAFGTGGIVSVTRRCPRKSCSYGTCNAPLWLTGAWFQGSREARRVWNLDKSQWSSLWCHRPRSSCGTKPGVPRVQTS